MRLQTRERSFHYKDKVDIVFDVLVSNYRFNLIDRVAGTSITVYLPVGMAVEDFRIEGDTVYFCGNYYRSLTNGGALVGWFSINDVFLNGGNIHYIVCNNSMSSDPPQDSFIHGIDNLIYFNRMRVVKFDGATHLLMIGGGMYIDTIDGGRAYPSVIADFWRCGNSAWRLDYTMDYYEQFSYDDIAVTEKYVVVTARNLSHPALMYGHDIIPYMKYTSGEVCHDLFRIQSGYYDGIAPLPIYHTDTSVMQQVGHISIETMTGDDFATVCNADIPNYGVQTVVSFYSNPYQPPVLRVSDNTPVYIGYRELAYNYKTKTLVMLPHSPMGWVRHLEYPYTSSIISTEVANSQYNWFSLHTSNGPLWFILSGTYDDLSLRTFWLFDEQGGLGCTNTVDDPVDQIGDTQNNTNYEQILNEYRPLEWECLPTDPEIIDLEIICPR